MSKDGKSERRVLVLMMNSHQHVESAEVKTMVRITGTIDKPVAELIEAEAEQKARDLMQREGIDPHDYSYMFTLVALTQGMYPGRIIYGRTPGGNGNYYESCMVRNAQAHTIYPLVAPGGSLVPVMVMTSKSASRRTDSV